MNLGPEEFGYFVTQVGLAAASFGVSKEDVTAVGESLSKLFGLRCAPPAVVVPSQGAQLQSMCQAKTCDLSPNDTCSAYGESIEPLVANATLAMGEGRNDTKTNGANNTTDENANKDGTTTGTSDTNNNNKSMASSVGISITLLGAAALAMALAL